MTELGPRLVSVLGLFFMIGVAWLCSRDRRNVPWRVVVWGLVLQLGLAVVLLRTPPGRLFFEAVNLVSNAILAVTEASARFMFGSLYDVGPSFLMSVFPIIIFMGSVFAILYHWGIIQRVIRGMALGQLGGGNLWWLLNRELVVAILNGLLWASLVAVGVALVFGDTTLGALIGIAMIINIIVAVVSGSVLPSILNALNVDPAIAGGVVLTTITDVAGFFVFLGLATLAYA